MYTFKLFIVMMFSLLILSVNAHAQNNNSAKFEFALIGDKQYDEKDFWKLDNVIEEINANKELNWVLHAGDIKSSATSCSDESYKNRFDQFQQFEIPLILTPGENDWAGCHGFFDHSRPLERRYKANALQPFERLTQLRKIFYPKPGASLGQKTMHVKTQANGSDYSEFVENVQWMKNSVMFATLHIVDSNNSINDIATHQKTGIEDKRHNNAALAWIQETFSAAKAQNARAVFLLSQVSTESDLNKMNSEQQPGFDAIFAAFEQESIKFGKPVILAYGDSHYYYSGDKQQSISTHKNLIHVNTLDTDDAHWLRVVVQPESNKVFTMHREIVKKNLEHHSSY